MTQANGIHAFELKSIDGQVVSLERYAGKVLLVVNVASECGFTPQYGDLQGLYEKYRDRGLEVLGVPSNDFGAQEPGTNPEIASFCESRYGVTFPLFEKVAVKGPARHPLYAFLTTQAGDVTWNFNKFLVARDGSVRRRYESKVAPLGAELAEAVERELG
jgi:glutathione peroxidase